MLTVRRITDTVSVSDEVEWFKKRGIEGVIEEVRRAQKDRDYYKAISFSCSYLQYRGKKLLGYKLV